MHRRNPPSDKDTAMAGLPDTTLTGTLAANPEQGHTDKGHDVHGLDADPHSPPGPTPRLRVTIIFHAPFDRVYALTSLGAMGIVLIGWATVIHVQLAGAVIAAVTLPWAARIAIGELTTPRGERHVDYDVQVLTDRPLPYVDTIGGDRP
jgi:hypothetical protein